MKRVYNFSAGPSALPLTVLQKAASELTDYNGNGLSVMEMTHRSSLYMGIISSAEKNLRVLMNIPDDYKVLFLQGGATTQFSAIPLNLMSRNKKAGYIVSGLFSKKAAEEAKKYGDVQILADSKGEGYTCIPHVDKFADDLDYVHICLNNTVYGTEFNYIPETGNIPLVADISSCILSKPIDVTKFGVLYAGAQKNMAPAGLTVVIIREDLLGNERPETPVMLNYKVQAENNSMYNTPPCYSIYMAGLVFEWLLEMGGLTAIEKINNKKAQLLYDCLDNSKLFKPRAKKEFRSIMNVCYTTGDEELDKKFCSEAAKKDLISLKAHRATGGIRASIYNAMTIEGVEALVDFMNKFEKENLV